MLDFRPLYTYYYLSKVIIPEKTTVMQPVHADIPLSAPTSLMADSFLSTASWYMSLTPWQQELVDSSYQLADQLSSSEPLRDYGCVVFGMAKAYEGFLKKYFLDLHLISLEEYHSRKFRIGRAFNPDVGPRQRNEFWIYDDVARLCGSDLARVLWDAWLVGRNQIFHYFPDEKGKLSLSQAKKLLEVLAEAMNQAIQCDAVTD
jgi:hypothetical protein